MKKYLAISICISLATILLLGCGKAKTTGGENKQTKGKYFEADFFSMFIAEGYTQMEINGGVQAYKGNNFIEIHIRGLNQTDADIEASIHILAKNFEGTAPDKVNMFGQTFYHSSIIAQGTSQDVYLAVKNGRKISITLSGKDHEKDENLKVMIESIKLKS